MNIFRRARPRVTSNVYRCDMRALSSLPKALSEAERVELIWILEIEKASELLSVNAIFRVNGHHVELVADRGCNGDWNQAAVAVTHPAGKLAAQAVNCFLGQQGFVQVNACYGPHEEVKVRHDVQLCHGCSRLVGFKMDGCPNCGGRTFLALLHSPV